jgi:hypothetical protein
MFEQEAAERATLLEGDIDDIAAKVLEILKEQGVV